MYEQHFGLERPPFQITPDPSMFYEGGKRGAVLEALVYALQRGEGIVKVVGEVGSGKTMICRMLELKLPDNIEVIYLANPSLSPDDILHAIARELDIDLPSEASKHEVMHELQAKLIGLHGVGKQVVIFIEEAQGMPLETLEEVRLLSNLETDQHKLLQIVLFGQPELDEHLALRSIRQLRERISHNFDLPPLDADEIHKYLNFRLRQVGYAGPELIDLRVAKAIAHHSDGLIRRVNLLADKTLLAGYSETTHDLAVKHVRTAAEDSAFPAPKARPRPPALRLGVAAAALLAAVGAGVLLAPTLPGGGGEPVTDAGDPGSQPGSERSPAVAVAALDPQAASSDDPAGPTVETASDEAVATAEPSETAEAPVEAPEADTPPAASIDPDEPGSRTAAVPPPADVEGVATAPTPMRKGAEAEGTDEDGKPTAMTAAARAWLDQKVDLSRDWMLATGPGRVTIQVMTRRKSAAHELVWYLREKWPLDLERTYIYEVDIDGRMAYRVLYHDYDDWDTGLAEIARLPASVQRNGPYLRRVPVAQAGVDARARADSWMQAGGRP